MNKFKTVVELKQITPYIHFQHDQAGATLRATEVKPKLDKFLWQNFKTEIESNKEWRIGETNALNYKLRFEAKGTKKVSHQAEKKSNYVELNKELRKLRKGTPEYKEKKEEVRDANKECQNEIQNFYFGNQGSKEEDIASYKETVFYEEGITMTIVCMIPDLLEKIKENIYAFFVLNNFGTRQNKGFGGFLVQSIDGKKTSKSPNEVIKECGKPYFYCIHDKAGSRQLMDDALVVYSVMKGGYNHTGYEYDRDTHTEKYKNPKAYFKGYIQRQYLDDLSLKNYGSDKVLIKQEVIKPQENRQDRFKPLTNDGSVNHTAPKSYSKFLFVRALLGLADHYEFRDNIRSENNNPENCYIVSLEGIERFASPITIKIFENSFYFIFDETKIESIKGKEFYFLDKKQYDEYEKTDEKNEFLKKKCSSIKVPNKFDTKKFIENFINYFEKTKYGFKKPGTRNDQYFPPFGVVGNLKLSV